MKLSKLLLAVVGATIVLGAFVSTAAAGRISLSGTIANASWTRLNFSGGFGTMECEIILNKTLHSRTFAKVRGSLVGFITAANITRCSRGSATILRETLPWHVQYESFAGTLPSITSVRTVIIGLSLRIREPTFGIQCLTTSTVTEPSILTYNLNSGGVMQSATVGGTIRCAEFNGSLSGTSSSITRVTVTLI